MLMVWQQQKPEYFRVKQDFGYMSGNIRASVIYKAKNKFCNFLVYLNQIFVENISVIPNCKSCVIPALQ